MSQHTQEQVAFLNAVLFGREHLILESTAGGGKTTTLIEAASVLPSPSTTTFFTYNKRQERVAQRLPRGVQASSVHSFGYRMLRAEAGASGRDTQVKLGRTHDLIRRLKYSWVQPHEIHSALAGAWDAWREELLSGDAGLDDIERLSGWAALKPRHAAPARWSAALRAALRDLNDLSLSDFQLSGTVDMTDMLWLPVQLGLGAGRLTHVLVDEAQDFTALRTGFVDHVAGLSAGTGRLIAAGDRDQTIFDYGMVRTGSLWALAERLGAQRLSLSVSFRLPQAVGELVTALGARTRCHARNPAGQVIHAPCGPQALSPARTTVLARTTARLLEFADLARASGRAATLADAQLGRTLTRAVTRTLRPGLPMADVAECLNHSTLNPGMCRAVTAIAARHRLDDQALSPTLDLPALLGTLHALTDPGSPDAEVSDTYLTVHAAKGREWPEVTVAWAEDLSAEPLGDHPESCVTFVALTRTRQTLRLLYGPQAWGSGVRFGQDRRVRIGSHDQAPNWGGWTLREASALPAASVPLFPSGRRGGVPALWPDLVRRGAADPIRSGALRAALHTALRSSPEPHAAAYLRRQLAALPDAHVWVMHDRAALQATQAHLRALALERCAAV